MTSNFFTRFDALIKIIFLVGFVVLGTINFLQWRQLKAEKVVSVREQASDSSLPGESSNTIPNEAAVVEICGKECEGKIRSFVAEAVATLSANAIAPTQRPSTSTPKPQAKINQVFYVPVGSSGSSTKTDWSDLTSTDFFFDIGEYGTVKEAKWSANIKIFQNGEAYARLYDVTHSVAVPGSEIKTTSYSYSLVESEPLKFLSGKNVYRVQMKSLTGYEASFDSGKIKISAEQ